MMKGEGYKYNIEAKNYIFKRNLSLLLEIFKAAEKLTDSMYCIKNPLFLGGDFL